MAATLSVVTITYNDPEGLEKTFNSLKTLHREGLHWEHIIVDSSPELNLPVISRLTPGWPLVHIKEEAHGIYHAQNTGLKNARQELIWFLNGGDQLTDVDVLKSILLQFERNSNLGLICAGARLTRNGRFLYNHIPKKPFVRNIWGANHICHQAVIYRSSKLREIGDFSTDLKFASDYEHFFRCYIAKIESSFMRQVLVSYDMGGRSSQYGPVFAEFKEIHRRLAHRLPKKIVVGNEMIRNLEFLRIKFFKFLSHSSFGSILQSLWYRWNRLLG